MSVVWRLDEAVEFVSRLAKKLRDVNYHVGITGGVLHRGLSHNDLDIIIYPASTAEMSQDDVEKILRRLGTRIYDRKHVRDTWAAQGSRDEKHVEVWEFGGKRVDIFFLA